MSLSDVKYDVDINFMYCLYTSETNDSNLAFIQCVPDAPCYEGCMQRDVQGVSWSLRGVPPRRGVDKTLGRESARRMQFQYSNLMTRHVDCIVSMRWPVSHTKYSPRLSSKFVTQG